MGIIAFRTPQEGIDKINEALGFLNLVHEVANNKDIKKTLDDLTRQVAATLELTEDKKKAAADAEEIIAQANEFHEELTKQKHAHQEKVNLDLAEIKKLQDQQAANQKAFELTASNKKASLDKMQKEAAELMAKATALQEENIKWAANLANLEKSLTEKQAQHVTTVSQFEAYKSQTDQEIKDRWSEHSAAMTKLAEAKKEVEAQKKMLVAALNIKG